MTNTVNTKSKIYIAGHNGMVGSACWRKLVANGYKNLIGFSSKNLDLRDESEVFKMLKREKPDAIIDAAAKVGGIFANHTYPFDFIIDNLLIQNNLIKSAHDLDIGKFIFLGSSCIYPKMAIQPIKEEYLLTDSLEPTNQWYAVAKISGVKMIEALRIQYGRDYTSLMPSNLYGPNDNYHINNSHVLPALIRKFTEAKTKNLKNVEVWGSGNPLREFLYVDDLASAVLFTLENKLPEPLYNVGSGEEISIKGLAEYISIVSGFSGKIIWDTSKPDGTPRKLLDSSKFLKLGWRPKISLKEGVINVYNDFIKINSI